jgi:hypothetical protein
MKMGEEGRFGDLGIWEDRLGFGFGLGIRG